MGEGKKKVRRKASRREKKDWVAGYVFIAPVTIGLLIFYVFPFIQNFWFSFNDVNKFNMATFCGISNYQRLFQEPDLMLAMKNTLLYAVVTVPIGLALSLLVASLLNSKIKGTSFYRTIYFLPSVTMSVAVALVWKLIFHGDFGILNTVLGIFGIEGQSWLTNPHTALFCVMIVAIWGSVGYNMIILLAGMQGISRSYYEAAAIDSIYMMVDPVTNPAFNKVKTMNVLFYQNAFMYGEKGYAAAISIFMFAVIMIITVIQLVGQKKWVNYD